MANKKRIVNAEAVARKLKKLYCAECNVVRKVQCSACWVEEVLELLEGDTVDAVEIDTIRAWLYEMAMNNTDNYLCNACEEIISRLDGLREFAKDGRRE